MYMCVMCGLLEITQTHYRQDALDIYTRAGDDDIMMYTDKTGLFLPMPFAFLLPVSLKVFFFSMVG